MDLTVDLGEEGQDILNLVIHHAFEFGGIRQK